MKKKRVLYIHHAGGLGGAPKSLCYIIQELNRDLYEPIILLIKNGPVFKLFSSTGAEIIIDEKLYPFHGTTVSGINLIRVIKNLIGFIITYIRFPKVLKRINPDLIHLNTTCLFVFALVAKRINPNIKIICHIREPILDSFHGDILRYFNKKYVDQFIAISNYDAKKLGDTDRMNIVYNFVDTEKYLLKSELKDNLRFNYRISQDQVIFLYFSRIAKSNGTIEMLRAANEVNKIRDDFHFFILGFDSQNKSAYNEKVKILSSKNKNIHLLNIKQEVIDIIVQADIVISPYLVPHFSRPVIEGAMMGKPAIISNVGSQNELVIHLQTGIIYELNEDNALQNAMLLLGTNRFLREKMGLNARKNAMESFDIKKNIIKIFEVYQYVLN